MEIIMDRNIKRGFYRSFNFVLLIIFSVSLIISSLCGWFWLIRLSEILIFVVCMFVFFRLKKEALKIIVNGKNLKLIYKNSSFQNISLLSVDIYENQLDLFSNEKNLILKSKEWSNVKQLEEAILQIPEIKTIVHNKKKRDFDFFIDIIDDIVN